MKILIICSHLPSFSGTHSFRVPNSIKYLSKKYMHNITIVSFKYLKDDPKQYDYLKEYCDEIETVDIPASLFHRARYYIVNGIIGIPSRKMQKRIKELLKQTEFDVILIPEVDAPSMLSYASDLNLPKVLEVWDIPQVHYEAYKKLEKKMHKKLLRLWQYFEAKNREKYYTKFDMCITPTERDRDILKSYLPNLEISVIPYGVNMDSVNKAFIEDFPSLIFTGNMGSLFNQRSILYFYDKIYPLIKKAFPEIKLCIVGKNPSEEIIQMARDKSVIVTGYVESLKPYLGHASVVTLPIHGYGIKTRLLEIMAMGKPVVTSSAGIHGINVTPEENIIIADEPEEFARRVIELLNDGQLRKRIGTNARKLMEEEYSWEKETDMLNEVLQKAVSKFHEK